MAEDLNNRDDATFYLCIVHNTETINESFRPKGVKTITIKGIFQTNISMKNGYITIETHPDHPGQIRVITSDIQPEPPTGIDGGTIRYIAGFNDVATAQMHVHEALKRKCEDIDARRYHAEIVEAIAAAESVELRHERIWMDPALDESALAAIKEKVNKSHQRHRLIDRIARIVGGIAVALLIMRMLKIF